MTPLLNYTTEVSGDKTVTQVEKILIAHKARAIMKQYDGEQVKALQFQVETTSGPLNIRLPVDIEATLQVMSRGGAPPRFQNRDQAYRVAWRIIKDWVEAQMALLETEMVRMEQIFLPYVVTRSGATLFEVLKEQKFLTGPKEADHAG